MDSSLVTLFLIIGLLSGTAMGILTWRLPAEILRPSSTGEAGSTSEFTFSGSRCCQCQTPLFWYDTVPLLGWMLLKGKLSPLPASLFQHAIPCWKGFVR